jgi:hypothetical protein
MRKNGGIDKLMHRRIISTFCLVAQPLFFEKKAFNTLSEFFKDYNARLTLKT